MIAKVKMTIPWFLLIFTVGFFINPFNLNKYLFKFNRKAPDFKLINHLGETRTLNNYKGKVLLVTFGYSNCTGRCVFNMQALKKISSLISDEESYKILFVTLDTKRDRPDLLKKYVENYNIPQLEALTESDEQINKVISKFNIFSSVKNMKDNYANYQIKHSDFLYLINQDGIVINSYSNWQKNFSPIIEDLSGQLPTRI